MAAANNISDCVIGKFTFKKRCNMSGSANNSVIQGSSESDMLAAEIVPADDTSRSPLQPIQLTMQLILIKTFIALQKVAYSVHNRDNQRQVGLYHEIIYSASVVYQIN